MAANEILLLLLFVFSLLAPTIIPKVNGRMPQIAVIIFSLLLVTFIWLAPPHDKTAMKAIITLLVCTNLLRLKRAPLRKSRTT